MEKDQAASSANKKNPYILSPITPEYLVDLSQRLEEVPTGGLKGRLEQGLAALNAGIDEQRVRQIESELEMYDKQVVLQHDHGYAQHSHMIGIEMSRRAVEGLAEETGQELALSIGEIYLLRSLAVRQSNL